MIGFDPNANASLEDEGDATYAYNSEGNRVNKTVVKPNPDDQPAPILIVLPDRPGTTGPAL